MRKFLIKILTLVLLLAAIAGVIQLLPPQFTETYDAEILDKYNRLITTPSPKIILIAGSSFAFGIDSAMMEDALHMPVVNLGLHAALRIHFPVEMAKANIQEGDIVVVGFEYLLYGDDNVGIQELFTTVENYYELWPYIDPGQYFRLAAYYFQLYGKQKVERFLMGPAPLYGVYKRSAFDSYGDISYDRPASTQSDIQPIETINKDLLAPKTIRYLNDFNAYVLSRGATLYLTYPCCEESGVGSTKEEIADFARTLEADVDFPVISNIWDSIMPDDLFYDNFYHLNDTGVKIRTRMLIDDIENAEAR